MNKTIEFENKKIETVEEFKLLGVTIDNKLNFDAFVAQQRISINQRLYMIKRQYYFPTKVKLTFFKAFILPCFDYCIELAIYFNKNNLQKLCKSYYHCLNVLFKFDLSNIGLHNTHDLLEPFGIDSFQHRIINRIVVFYAKIMSNEKSPVELRNAIQIIMQLNPHYKLRSNEKMLIANERTYTKYGDKTFKSFGTKLINNMNCLLLDLSVLEFKKFVKRNIKSIVDIFISLFDTFDLDINFYFYKKPNNNLNIAFTK